MLSVFEDGQPCHPILTFSKQRHSFIFTRRHTVFKILVSTSPVRCTCADVRYRSFIFVLAVRKLIKDVKSSSDIIVYEYQPEKDEFVAVATQKAEKRELKNAFSIVKREVSNTFIAIINTFKKGENKKRLDFFKAQFPKTRRINNVIKIMLAVIIGLWLLTILL